jgi:hypothetical protein
LLTTSSAFLKADSVPPGVLFSITCRDLKKSDQGRSGLCSKTVVCQRHLQGVLKQQMAACNLGPELW